MKPEASKTLKAGWRRVRFGDVVRQCKEKVDPETSGLNRYVAGDHMDTDDLRLRRWGEIGSGYLGPAFHMRFKPGHVLYGSRRTYLRKVALADFDGICANTTFVLEPKDPEQLLPEFLPLLMQTDSFNEFSVKSSKGSVNPYINFSDLAKFELALPSLDVQRRLVDIFDALENIAESLRNATASATTLKAALAEKTFPVSEVRTLLEGATLYQGRSLARLGEVASLQVGFPFKSAEYAPHGDRLLRGSNVGVNRLIWDSAVTSYWPSDRRSEVIDYVLNAGDVVIAMDRPFIAEGFKIARISEFDLPALLLQRVGRFQLSNEITSDYLWAFLHSESFKWQLQRMQKGTDLPHISRFDIEGTIIPILTLEEQSAVADQFSSIESSEVQLLRRLDISRAQKKNALKELVAREASSVQ
ncbi:MAG: restriction endonuclease subunit S [Gammaproteobacteria bacterium]|nr:restriction endonuclease subunit S [Gammaproteobacteria bacterium]MBU1442766.1 restriction endonuclease subunit S [Gammaproteobacteria bacterium]MBU2409917.1 restriction endonuclease subunit S [Gammaproteobacteria bacterium]